MPSEAARATTGRSVLSGGLWYVASYAIPQGYTLIVSIVAARFLGPDGMGRQSFIAFVAITTTTVLSTSMYTAVMRYIGETAGRGRAELLKGLLWWAWRVEGTAALLGGAIVGIPAALGSRPQGAWAFAAVVCAVGILHTVPTSVLIGLQRFRRAAVVGLVTGFVGTPAVAIVLWQGGGITGMFATEAVVAILNLAWTGTLARRSLSAVERDTDETPDPGDLRTLRRNVGRFAVLSSLGVFLQLIVGTRSEFFFLAHYSSDAQIAFYSIAYSAVAALRLVPQSLANATAPAFATLFGAREFDRIRSGYSRSLRLLVIATLPLTAAGLALGPELIEEIYGRSYAGAGGPVQILLAAFPIIALSSLANSLLSGFAKIRIPLVANAIAAAVDLGLAAALVPLLDARGAAIANGVGQAVYALIVLAAASRLAAPVEWRLGALTRNAVAAGVAGFAGWAVLQWLDGFSGLAVAAAALTLAYAALAVTLSVLPAQDAAWLEETLGGRFVARVTRLCASRK